MLQSEFYVGRGLVVGLCAFGFAAVAMLGCGPSPTPKAAQSLACAKEQVTTEKADHTGAAVVATGCGKTDVLTYDNGKWASLRERAAFEMSCAAAQLEVTPIESTVFGVTGCNRKIVYKWNIHVGIVVQTASETAGPAPADPGAAPAAPPAGAAPAAAN